MHKANILIFALFYLQAAHAQGFFGGLGFSASNYSGDLTRDNEAIIRQTSPGFGMHTGYMLDRFFGFRMGYEHLTVTANDAISAVEWQKKRNLNFSSIIHSVDLTAMVEIMPLIYPQGTRLNLQFTGGYSFFHFNPQGSWNGTKISLRDLGTEGQGMPGYKPKYNLNSDALTMGAGARYSLSQHWSIQGLLLMRKTNTDYLDDLSSDYVDYKTLESQNGSLAAQLGNKINAPGGSQRGNPIDNDWYQSVSIQLVYHIIPQLKTQERTSQRKLLHCPKF